VWWREVGSLESEVFRGADVPAGARIAGPALIEHPGTTIAVHPGQEATVDGHGNTTIEIPEGRRGGDRPSHL
jgi:N-methylhydantoinase A